MLKAAQMNLYLAMINVSGNRSVVRELYEENSAYRLFTLRVYSVFRTTPDERAYVIAKITPIDHLVSDDALLFFRIIRFLFRVETHIDLR